MTDAYRYMNPDPYEQFRIWFDAARNSSNPQPDAMALATVSRASLPSVRMVLLKAFDRRGFVFFTNYNSRKARELEETGYAAAAFFWANPCQRQVRIEGRVEKISEEESDMYFLSRPRGSQIAAWASPQSAVIPDRGYLESLVEQVERRFQGKQVSRPEFWGGYRIVPHAFEFWEGKPNRLHDRFRYLLKDGTWSLDRLAP
ncbi:pyridoxamine 5'-phosphate oxidase [Thermobaculum terrenum ATCC BAA-798]|uniref:Pyridoxamine 5'-phosphate oxidase n=1 Tax=Thermobaculum terrenum (strain ATCC BAA-798 / CCMEE 7001 / YNP1) TaxID=525904 RepID=D1CFP6_THET1|nr:pyridoxamine 5'-phosphate oxidase [Thermobaculum terrenum]ACZ41752.1 pyridoxamine 5'-phosphate oxidase [Thermobaculum terrenum ATCC BAA-798]